MMKQKRGSSVLLGLAFVASLVSLAPLWYLIHQSLSRGISPFIEELTQRRTLHLILRSVVLSTSVTLASVVLGVVTAWVIALSGLRGQTFLTIAFSLPLAIPSYLSAFAWISWQPRLHGFWGAFIVLSFASYPYVMLPVAATMSRLNPVHEDIARTMGRTNMQIMFGIILPQLRRSISSGALLVALYALSDFGAVAAMRHEVFTWVIYGAYRAGFNPTRAATLSIVLVFAAFALTLAESRASRTRNQAPKFSPSRYRRAQPSLTTTCTTLVGSTCALIPAVGVPVATIISWLSRNSTRTTDWSDVWSATVQSFLNGSLTAIASLILALPIAWSAVRISGRLSAFPERFTYITHALPGIVVAISVVYVGIRVARPWYQELPLLIFGQVIILLPVMAASLRTAFEKTPVALEEVAHSLGVGKVSTLIRVVFPIALPGILAGSTLSMLAAVKELPVTLLLRPTGMNTLSTRIWDFSTISDYAAVGPFALAMLVLAAVPTALLGTLSVVKDGRS